MGGLSLSVVQQYGLLCCGSLRSLDWNGGMEWWNRIVECVLWGERSLLIQFSIKVTPVEVAMYNHCP